MKSCGNWMTCGQSSALVALEVRVAVPAMAIESKGEPHDSA